MDSLEYSFGNGVDAPTTWTSLADLSVGAMGSIDAVRLDFDGDGLLDDAMWDSGGDGVADHSVLDVDDADDARFFTDPSGEGTWNREVQRPDAAPLDFTEYSPTPSGPWAGPSYHDGSVASGYEVRPVSVEPLVLGTGNVSRPSLLVESDSASVDGDGEQSGCVDGRPAQREAQ